eukprot:3120003-Rhodomonas_salina.1
MLLHHFPRHFESFSGGQGPCSPLQDTFTSPSASACTLYVLSQFDKNFSELQFDLQFQNKEPKNENEGCGSSKLKIPPAYRRHLLLSTPKSSAFHCTRIHLKDQQQNHDVGAGERNQCSEDTH